ncbi:MAG: tetratricopeptide repeat protein [Gemmatimonadetes bacterium]|nr:tetratricopeptide repeat protein [Gemmatimonadota bacterium]NNM04011.1 tetratricopeptide repeat protein [Gemmatimonadota bacterium]
MKPPFLRALVLVSLVFSGGASSTVLAQAGAESGGSWEGLMAMGNTRYQENDFAGALEAYASVLEAGLESPSLHYNLGNSYFKIGDLGRAILSYERALRLNPGDPDIRANLELARSLTTDEIEPLPRFWVFSVLSWWTNLLPRRVLLLIVASLYVLGSAGLCARILSRSVTPARIGNWLLVGSGLGLLLFGSTLLGRAGLFGAADWGIIMAEEVSVRSAPAAEDDLTLFRVHEGTKVRLDQRTELWSEVVLEDGRVGWVPSEVLEII